MGRESDFVFRWAGAVLQLPLEANSGDWSLWEVDPSMSPGNLSAKLALRGFYCQQVLPESGCPLQIHLGLGAAARSSFKIAFHL